MDIFTTQKLLDRLSSLLRSESRNLLHEHGLQPVQFEALYYLSICNRYSDTPMGVTEYLKQTKGSVSQTLKVLEKKGLIVKTADTNDKRVAHLSVTPNGRTLIDKILPSPSLQMANDFLNSQEIEKINTTLTTLLSTIQRANNFKSFGQCASCVHNIKSKSNDFFCGLTKEPLSQLETELICREHESDEFQLQPII